MLRRDVELFNALHLPGNEVEVYSPASNNWHTAQLLSAAFQDGKLAMAYVSTGQAPVPLHQIRMPAAHVPTMPRLGRF